MAFLYTALGLLLFLLIASYCIYRFVFYHVPGTEKDQSVLPEAAQSLLDKRKKDMLEESFERVKISSFDGLSLSGKLYSAEKDAPIVIACHGYKGSADYSFACVFPIYRKLGFRILVIDQRAHGQSEGRTLTLGVLEPRDVASWVQYMTRRFGGKVPVTLWGVSMGGASVLSAASLCPELCCIVSDCAFTSPAEILLYQIKSKCCFGAGALLLLTRFSTRLWGGFSLMDANALDTVQKTKIPILFIHGELDTFVPYEMGKRLYQACNSEKRFLSVPEAMHARNAAIQPELYEKAVVDFVKTCLYATEKLEP